ncbi:MAG TPA: hypothetical protein VD970_02300 [Acetobacteraceae bacterium]|nr:hypothetical protein [Acetobacteraceae bacterium]
MLALIAFLAMPVPFWLRDPAGVSWVEIPARLGVSAFGSAIGWVAYGSACLAFAVFRTHFQLIQTDSLAEIHRALGTIRIRPGGLVQEGGYTVPLGELTALVPQGAPDGDSVTWQVVLSRRDGASALLVATGERDRLAILAQRIAEASGRPLLDNTPLRMDMQPA